MQYFVGDSFEFRAEITGVVDDDQTKKAIRGLHVTNVRGSS
jgi:hypothetical protein